MNIRHILSLLVIALIVASCGSTKEVKEDPVVAKTAVQEKTSLQDRSGDLSNRPRRQVVDPEQLVAQLGLDEPTEEKFLSLWESSDAKMKAIREEAKGGDRSGMREKMKNLRDERQNGLKQILTAQQLAKLKQLTSNKTGKKSRGGRG